ncbi:ABC transporter substrate-binding protein [Halarcobacter ebronensis]|nr:ABC transporter substrate-binding protein [Halarcobacter ebronensis]QKF81614.1 lipid asymmetry ABC transporter MlaABCDEF, periplasmic component MlaC [Halarcobacter ebronensis]
MIKKFLFLNLLVSTLLFALTKDEIQPEMTIKINSVLSVLKDSNLTKEAKKNKIIPIIDPLFDFTLMSRLSLGAKWKELDKGQKDRFTELFTKKLKESYTDKLYLYTDQKVDILGVDQPKNNRIVLKTQLIGKDDKYDIGYKFYETKDSSWLIYDVDLLGVSIIQTYRQQFAGFLKDKSFDDLLTNLSTTK